MTFAIFKLRLLGFILFIIAMVLLWQLDWKIPVGVFLFGWSLNLEQEARKREGK